MPAEVALALLERNGRWLMQLRDDVPGIVGPGCWGLFGGHLDPGETAQQALERELLEEIGWSSSGLEFRLLHSTRGGWPMCSAGHCRCPWSSCSCWRGRTWP